MAAHRKYPIPTASYKDKRGVTRCKYKDMSVEQRAVVNATQLEYRKNNPERMLLNRARVRAKKYNIPFDLQVSDITIPDVCPVFGMPLEVKFGSKGGKPNSPSLDRIDPNKGYVKDNIIVVSNKANAIKSNATPDEILAVAQFYKEKCEGPRTQLMALQVALPLDEGMFTY